MIASCSDDGTAKVWDIKNKTLVVQTQYVITQPETDFEIPPCNSLAFIHNEKYLVFSRGNTIDFLEIQTARFIAKG